MGRRNSGTGLTKNSESTADENLVMKNPQIIALVLIGSVGLAMGTRIHHRGQADIEVQGLRFKKLQEQTLALEDAIQPRLQRHQTNRSKERVIEQRKEIEHLRDESRALERRIGSLKAQLENRSKTRSSAPKSDRALTAGAGLFVAPIESRSSEYLEELERTAVNRSEIRHLTSAVRQYARNNEGAYPPSLEAALPYLWEGRQIPEIGRYELVFQGSIEELRGIPPAAIALVRERQPWKTPSGKLARVYGMLAGNVEVVESDDQFAAWELNHVLPPSE